MSDKQIHIFAQKLSQNPELQRTIASAMVQVEKQRRLKRLGKKKQREIIANYFVIESEPFRNSKFKTKY